MTEATIAIDVSTPPSVLRVVLAGAIDLSNAEEVQRGLIELTSNQLSRMIVDLSGLTYISSAGLRVLYVLATRLEIAQIALELVAPRGSLVRRTIEAAGMATMVPISPPPG